MNTRVCYHVSSQLIKEIIGYNPRNVFFFFFCPRNGAGYLLN